MRDIQQSKGDGATNCVGVIRTIKEHLAKKVALKVRRAGGVECWPWVGARYATGYGHMTVCGKPMLAHRVAYELAHGEIPAGLIVRHSCDNPSCCNPSHLLIGTIADNMRDKCERGRQANGERHPRHKLAEHQVFDVVARLKAGDGPRAVADAFGVCIGTIIAIRDGRTWPTVTGLRPLDGVRRQGSKTKLLIQRAGRLPRTGHTLDEAIQQSKPKNAA